MNLTYGNVYEFKFEESGPRPPNMVDIPFTRITGASIQDALERWEKSRSEGYNPWYPPIVAVTKILDGVSY